jgi:hypothetical protein
MSLVLMGPGRLAEEYVRTHGRKVSQVMTLDPVTISEETPLDGIVDLMERHQPQCLKDRGVGANRHHIGCHDVFRFHFRLPSSSCNHMPARRSHLMHVNFPGTSLQYRDRGKRNSAMKRNSAPLAAMTTSSR